MGHLLKPYIFHENRVIFMKPKVPFHWENPRKYIESLVESASVNVILHCHV